jgi:positive regulator of sigma E activity
MSGTKVVVVKIESDGAVWVRPVIEGMCISCDRMGSCGKRGTPFRVMNSANFPVCAGDTVVIAASRRASIAQGLYALLFPIAFAALGYASAPLFAGLLGIVAGEGLKALGVLVFLFAASGIVLVTRKFARKWVKPEITGVEDTF